MSFIGTVEGVLKLRDEFSDRIGFATKSLLSAGVQMRLLGQQMSNAGMMMTRTISLPLAALAGVSVKAATDFESSFTGIEKTVEATEEQFAALSDELRDLAKNTLPVNINALNAVGEAAGQLGIRVENIRDFTENIVGLSVAAENLTLDEGAKSLARLDNIMGTGQKSFDRMGSSIIDLGNNFATTEKEIVTMTLRIAGVGRFAGFTTDQVLGLAAAASSVGIAAEIGGTALQKAMARMLVSVSTADKRLKVFAGTAGQTIEEFSRGFRENAGLAFQRFLAGIGKLGEEALPVLEKLGLQNQRTIRALVAMGNASDLVADAMNRSAMAWRENTALTQEAERRYATFASKVTITVNKLRDMAITLGDAFLPILRDLLDLLDPVIGKLAEWAEAFQGLPKWVRLLTLGIGALVAVLGPVIFVLGQIIQTAGTIAISLVALRVILPGLAAAFAKVAAVIFGPIGLVVALGALLLSSEKVRSFIAGSLEPVLSSVAAQYRKASAAIKEVWTSSENARVFLGEFAKLLGQELIGFLRFTWMELKAVVGFLKDMIIAVKDAIVAVWQFIASLARAALEIKLLGDIVDSIGDVFRVVFRIIKSQLLFLDQFGVPVWRSMVDAILRLNPALGKLVVHMLRLGAEAAENAKRIIASQQGWANLNAEVERSRGAFVDMDGPMADFNARLNDMLEPLRELLKGEEGEKSIKGVTNRLAELREEVERDLLHIARLTGAFFRGEEAFQATKDRLEALNRVIAVTGDEQSALASGLVELVEEAIQARRRLDELENGFDGYVTSLKGVVIDLTRMTDSFAASRQEVISNIEVMKALAERADRLKLPFREVLRVLEQLGLKFSDVALTAEELDRILKILEDRAGDVKRSFEDIFSNDVIPAWKNAVSNALGDVLRILRDGTDDIGAELSNLFAGIGAQAGFVFGSAFGGPAVGQLLGFVGETLGAKVGEALGSLFGGDNKDRVLEAVKALGLEIGETLLQSIRDAALVVGDISAAIRSLLSDVIQESGINALGDLINFITQAGLLLDDLDKKLLNSTQVSIQLADSLSQILDSFSDVGGSITDLDRIADIFTGVIDRVAAGLLTIEEANRVFNQSFEQFVQVARNFGEEGLALIAAVVQAAQDAGVELEGIGAALDAIMDEAMDVLEQRNRFLQEQANQLVSSLENLMNLGGLTAREMEFVASSLMAAFNAMQEAGMSITQIVDRLRSALDSFLADDRSLDLLGDNSAFADFIDLLETLSDDTIGRLLSQLEAMGGAVDALGNMGLLTADQFDTFGDRVRRMFRRLINQGLTSAEALAAMAPQLQLLNDLAQMYGFTIDRNTQKLIDMAKNQGLVSDQGLTMEDILIEGFNRMLAALNAVIEALGGVPIIFDDWVDSADDAADAIGNGFMDMVESIGDGLNDLLEDARRNFEQMADDAEDAARRALGAWEETAEGVNGVILDLNDNINNGFSGLANVPNSFGFGSRNPPALAPPDASAFSTNNFFGGSPNNAEVVAAVDRLSLSLHRQQTAIHISARDARSKRS